jgi:sec-independent protein translocase protein TatB
MFDIGWSELLVIGVVALIFIGPKELPTVLRTVGQWVTKIRRMASEFQNQFHEAMREAEMADLKKQVDDLGNTTSNFTNFDPVGTVRKELEGVFEDKSKPSPDTSAAPPPATPAADAPPVPPSPSVEPSAIAPGGEPVPPPAPSAAPVEPAASPEPAAPAPSKDFAEAMPAPKHEGPRA